MSLRDAARGRWAATSDRAREVLAVLLVLAAALPLGALALRVLPDGSFYQAYFAPAAMLACGEGYTNVAAGGSPTELDRFLSYERRSLDCDALRDAPKAPLTDFQHGARWLLTGTAAVWWLSGGPSWDVLLPLELALLALSALAAYGMLRLLTRRAIAAPFAVLAVMAPIHLSVLPHLRDYSKVPFLLLGCLGIATGALGTTLRRRLTGAALGGVAVGIGLGFRSDVLILIPLGVVALLVQPWEGRTRLWRGPAVAAVFLVGFALAAAPILPSYADGSNNGGIVAVEGLMPEFTERLGLRSELYEIGYFYNDAYAHGLAAAHGRLIQGKPGAYEWGSPELDNAANELYFAQASFLSADAALRAAAAAFESLRLAGAVPRVPPENARWEPALELAAAPFSQLLLGVPVFLGTLVLLGASRPRGLLVAMILGGGLASVTALQFDERHAFHLAIVAWLVLAGLLEWAVSRRRLPPLRRVAMSAAALGLLGVVSLGVYAILRAEQDRRVDTYLADLERAPRVPVAGRLRAEPDGGSLTLARDAVESWEGVPGLRTAYLRLAVGRCTARDALLVVRYRAAARDLDFTSLMPLRLEGHSRATAIWYVVAVATPGTRPSAVELSGAPGCHLRADRIRPREVPVLLNVRLDRETRRAPRHIVLDTRELWSEALP